MRMPGILPRGDLLLANIPAYGTLRGHCGIVPRVFPSSEGISELRCFQKGTLPGMLTEWMLHVDSGRSLFGGPSCDRRILADLRPGALQQIVEAPYCVTAVSAGASERDRHRDATAQWHGPC